MPDKVTDMKAFCFTGWSTLAGEPTVGTGGRAAFLDSISDNVDAGLLPATPSITYTGAVGYPIDGLTFAASAFSDPQDGSAFTTIQWRAGEITDPSAPGYDPAADRLFEADEVWSSGERVGPSVAIAIPAGVLRAGHTYRVRARYKDATGRFSHWSAPLPLTSTEGTYDRVLTENLYISEVMYKPAPASLVEASAPNFWAENDFEFIELTNRSTVLTLSLDNVRFTKGIDYDIAPGASLAPGATKVLVHRLDAFRSRYPSVPLSSILGEWDVAGTPGAGDSLSNGGEQLKISFGAGNAIHDITYDDAAPWPLDADNGGVSMVYAGGNTLAGAPDPQASGNNWVAGCILGGTPGIEDLFGFSRWMQVQGETVPSADANNDGWDNHAAFAFGRDIRPQMPTTSIITDAGADYIQFTYTRRRCAARISYIEEASTDMSGWNTANVQSVSTLDNNDGTETRLLRITIPIGVRNRCYIRARAVSQ